MSRHILVLVLALSTVYHVANGDANTAKAWKAKVAQYAKENKEHKILFRVEGPNGPKSIKTYDEAVKICEKNGAAIADNWRVRDFVGGKNYDRCQGCGWCKRSGNGKPRYYYKNHRPICGKKEEESGVFFIPCGDTPQDEGLEGYDVYCYGLSGPEVPGDAVAINTKDNTGYVFAVRHSKNEAIATRSLAQTLCELRAAELATSEQMEQAWFNGLSACACGWMKNWAGMAMNDEILTCGGQAAKQGCPFGRLTYAYCFVDARSNPRCQNGVDFSDLKEQTYPMGIEPGAVQVDGGYVYMTKHPKGPLSAMNIFMAHTTCRVQGGEVATPEKLELARKAGFDECVCAWTWENAEVWAGFMVRGDGAVKKVCKSGTKDCPLQNPTGDGYNIHCFKQCPQRCPDAWRWNIPPGAVQIHGGMVFHVQGAAKYSLTKTSASAECGKFKGKLATRKQLDQAQFNGLSRCRCGFLEDGSTVFPIARIPIYGCGNEVGVFSCPGSPGQYIDMMETGPKWDAYCFVDDASLRKPSKYDEAKAKKTEEELVDDATVASDFNRGGKPKTGYSTASANLYKAFKKAQKKKG